DGIRVLIVTGVQTCALPIFSIPNLGRSRLRRGIDDLVLIAATGDEIVDASAQPGTAQIRNGNGPALAGALASRGIRATSRAAIRSEERRAGRGGGVAVRGGR